jgi:hypothetical protein
LVAKGFTTADAVELLAQLSSTTAVVAANLTQLFTPDDRGYYKFNRSAIRFMPDFGFSKIRDDSYLKFVGQLNQFEVIINDTKVRFIDA